MVSKEYILQLKEQGKLHKTIFMYRPDKSKPKLPCLRYQTNNKVIIREIDPNNSCEHLNFVYVSMIDSNTDLSYCSAFDAYYEEIYPLKSLNGDESD